MNKKPDFSAQENIMDAVVLIPVEKGVKEKG